MPALPLRSKAAALHVCSSATPPTSLSEPEPAPSATQPAAEASTAVDKWYTVLRRKRASPSVYIRRRPTPAQSTKSVIALGSSMSQLRIQVTANFEDHDYAASLLHDMKSHPSLKGHDYEFGEPPRYLTRGRKARGTFVLGASQPTTREMMAAALKAVDKDADKEARSRDAGISKWQGAARRAKHSRSSARKGPKSSKSSSHGLRQSSETNMKGRRSARLGEQSGPNGTDPDAEQEKKATTAGEKPKAETDVTKLLWKHERRGWARGMRN